RHEDIAPEARAGVPGLLSRAGGTLAAYRLFAEEATDVVLKKLGHAPRPCVTGPRPLPGAEEPPDFQALARRIPLPPAAIERVWRRLGSRAADVLGAASPAELAPICRSEAVTAGGPPHGRAAGLAAGSHPRRDRRLPGGPLDPAPTRAGRRRPRPGGGAARRRRHSTSTCMSR